MAFQQYEYLIGKFKDGNFPTGQDFNDLIDSTYNFSLSNLPEFGLFLQSVSGNWENTYQTYNALSADYATLNYVNDNFLNLAGGTIDSSLDVQQSILSGGTNLLSIFRINPQQINFNENNFQLEITEGGTVSLSALSGDKQELTFDEIIGRIGITNGNTLSLSALSGGKQELTFDESTGRIGITNGNTLSLSALSGGKQELTYNRNNYELGITNGNKVSLSDLASYITIPFSHSAFNPSNNTIYRFGSISNLQPVAQQDVASRQAVSQFNGIITEASIILDNTNATATNETSLFTIRNITKNLSANISNIRYKEGVSDTALFGPVLFNIPNAAPEGWVPATNTAFVIYSETNVSINNGGSITSPIIAAADQYDFLKIEFRSLNSGGGPNPVIADVIINDVSQGLNIPGRTDDTENAVTSILNLTASNGINPILTSNTTKIRLSNTSSISTKLITRVSLSGVKIVSTGSTQNYVVTPLPVSKNDLLEVIWTTPTWEQEPTDVVNLITAKMLLSANQS